MFKQMSDRFDAMDSVHFIRCVKSAFDSVMIKYILLCLDVKRFLAKQAFYVVSVCSSKVNEANAYSTKFD